MDDRMAAQTLSLLLLLDFDLAHAYEEAVEKVSEQDVQDQFTLFRNDHQRHVFVLSRLIQELGGQSPQVTTDFKAYLTTEVSSPKTARDTHDLFSLMLRNEKQLSDAYGRVMEKQGLPDKALAVLRKNFADEEKHIGYIESALSLSPLPR